jgi:flagellar motor switch protein FliM
MTVPPGEESEDPVPATVGTEDSEDPVPAVGNEESADEQENLAAEWEEMTSAPESDRVLNQDEIDSLLGFDEEATGIDDKTGIQAIITAARSDRLPMLDVVFDRLVRLMSTSLRNFTSDNVEVSLKSIDSFKFGDYLNSVDMPAMLNVFKAEEWDASAILVVNSGLIYSMIDVLLGGKKDAAQARFQDRAFTTIECNLTERMVHIILSDLSTAFEPLSPVHFRFDRLETNPRFATICKPSDGVIVAKVRIDMEDRGGVVEILIPYSTLEPIRELLHQGFMGEKGRDSIWETHLLEELWVTEVDLTVVLDEQILSLGQIFDLKVGSQLKLKATPSSPVDLRCGSIPLFKGVMGRKDENIAIKISETLIKEVE